MCNSIPSAVQQLEEGQRDGWLIMQFPTRKPDLLAAAKLLAADPARLDKAVAQLRAYLPHESGDLARALRAFTASVKPA